VHNNFKIKQQQPHLPSRVKFQNETTAAAAASNIKRKQQQRHLPTRVLF
jgi:hypothetical protein